MGVRIGICFDPSANIRNGGEGEGSCVIGPDIDRTHDSGASPKRCVKLCLARGKKVGAIDGAGAGQGV